MMCIDVEPDPREVELRVEPWHGFEKTFEHFHKELRPKISALTGAPVHYVWFWRVDPQIELAYGDPAWGLKHYADQIKELEKAGDEIAVHPHTWAWNREKSSWFVDNGNQKWVEHCVSTARKGYRDVYGRDCDSIRVGDRWINNATVRFIENLGFKYDLTLEPGQPWWSKDKMLEPFTDDLPDYGDVPLHPYRPSLFDYKQPGQRARGRGLDGSYERRLVFLSAWTPRTHLQKTLSSALSEEAGGDSQFLPASQNLFKNSHRSSG